jgi:hypothetical protein
VFAKSIEGHSRLFLLVRGDIKRPTAVREIKETFGKIGYDKGVRQIVDLSSFTVRTDGKQCIIGYMYTTGEEKLWTLADEKPDERSLVALSPGAFLNNQFMIDMKSIKHANKLISSGSSSSTETWIDTKGDYY